MLKKKENAMTKEQKGALSLGSVFIFMALLSWLGHIVGKVNNVAIIVSPILFIVGILFIVSFIADRYNIKTIKTMIIVFLAIICIAIICIIINEVLHTGFENIRGKISIFVQLSILTVFALFIFIRKTRKK